MSSVALPSPSLSIASTDQPLAKSVPVGKQLQMYAAESLGAKLSDVQKVTLGNLTTQISTLWLVVRYVLQ